MKFVILLCVIGSVFCDADTENDGRSDGKPDLLSGGSGFSSKPDIFGTNFDQSPPPAVVSAAEAGVQLDSSLTGSIPNSPDTSNFPSDFEGPNSHRIES